MERIRDIALVIAALAVVVALAAGVVPGLVESLKETISEAGAVELETVEEALSAAVDALTGAAPKGPDPDEPPATPEPVVKIEPQQIVIYGESRSPWASTVDYEPVRLLVAEVTGKPISPTILHPLVHPANAQGQIDLPFEATHRQGEAELVVTHLTEELDRRLKLATLIEQARLDEVLKEYRGEKSLHERSFDEVLELLKAHTLDEMVGVLTLEEIRDLFKARATDQALMEGVEHAVSQAIGENQTHTRTRGRTA